MTKPAFNPYNYEDQLRKYHPEIANKILVEYGHIDKAPRDRSIQVQPKVCRMCGEIFKPRSGIQLYCRLNSKGERCGYKNKGLKNWKRKHA